MTRATQDVREAWGPVSRVKNLNRQVGTNYPPLIEALGEVIDGQYWREFESAGTGNVLKFDQFDEFLNWCNFPPKEVVAVLEAHQEHALLARVRAELGGELAEHGEIGKGRTVRDGDTNSKKDNDATYVVARLNRDRPDLAEKVMAGELSPNAAAVEAGFRKGYLRVRADDVRLAMKKAAAHFGASECRAALQELEGQGPE